MAIEQIFIKNMLPAIISLIDYTHYELILTVALILEDNKLILREGGGVVVERRTPNREVLDSIPTGVIVLCPCARHINSLQY